MTKLPRISGRDLIAALEKGGFEVIRIRGSHHFLRHHDGRQTVVPVHRGETIGPGLVSKILRECEMTPDELAALVHTS
jgi:predicted RNA binding protein YcfA (HicA-like mRNA interferase family)